MANVGIVSKWIASGQGVVARQIRSALDELGHETFVLARPGSGPRAEGVSPADKADPVWRQEGITEGSTHEIPLSEYEEWARECDLDAILCDENYQFKELAFLREQGLRTIGRFVWEYFGAEHVDGAKEAFETIYSLTRCERVRYAELGIESPYVQWGIHPELYEVMGEMPSPTGTHTVLGGGHDRQRGRTYFYFPGSFLGKRKPIRKVIKAFQKAEGDHLRLVISAQVPRNAEMLHEAAAEDPRIELALEDEPEQRHRERMAACDVLIAPSRWEGLGLPLYEATAYGMPIITNDQPPMSEMVNRGKSGVLITSTEKGTARSGIPAWDPDVGEMTEAIELLGNHEELERCRRGVLQLQKDRRWELTVEGFAELLG